MSKPASAETTVIKDGPLNIFKYRWVFLGLSLIFLIPGVYCIFANMVDPEIQAPIRLGIDFKGGTLLEYGFSQPVTQPEIANIREVFDKHGYTGSIIQIQAPRVGINKAATEIGAASSEKQQPAQKPAEQPKAEPVKPAEAPKTEAGKATPQVAQTEATTAEAPKVQAAGDHKFASIVSIRSKMIEGHQDQVIQKELEAKYGHITLLQRNSIGPALAKELLSNGLLALVMAYILIVGYLTFRFQFDFAVCAVLALLHDTIFLFGMFAIFSRLFNTEVDSLFITSVLTVIGFSVHDTIVVFDRIRENNRIYFTKKIPFVNIVNMSVNQTLARSINTSLTALLTMIALYFFGGETTKDFVLAIIIGIAAGTYSSIFNASVLLAMWRNRGVKAQPTAAVPASV